MYNYNTRSNDKKSDPSTTGRLRWHVPAATLPLMIRPFHLRDLALVHRLGEHGVVFQTQSALTRVSNPVRQAIVHLLLGGNISTYVWKAEDGNAAGFAQLTWGDQNSSAHLACIGTENIGNTEKVDEDIDEDIWLALLDDLTAVAGQRGFHNIIAEASENGSELPIFRRAGYAVYTRQDIWICDHPSDGSPSDLLVPRQAVDDWDITVLYSNIVPGLIQSVEPNPPINSGQNWILREDGEMAAFVHIFEGSVANWMRLFIHPNAETRPKRIVEAVLQKNPPSLDHPIYCSVPRYQSWLQTSLEKAGFRLWGSQAVLVKHIAQQAEKRVMVTQGVLEAQTVPSSSPLIQGFSRHNGRNHR
jgi:hypothetical protein